MPWYLVLLAVVAALALVGGYAAIRLRPHPTDPVSEPPGDDRRG